MAAPTLTTRTALVTGASRGIGKAIADVAVNYRQRKDEAAATVAAIKQLGRRSAAFAADVSDARDVAAMVSSAERALGPIDILVNNAGIAVRHSLEDITEADFDHTIAVNLKSAFLCTQAVWPGMRARGAGGFGVHYNASKAGMEGLTRGYAARLLNHGITVNAVAPSLIDTEMIASQRETIAATLPLKRLTE